jgi:hypothetical protein
VADGVERLDLWRSKSGENGMALTLRITVAGNSPPYCDLLTGFF